MGELKKWLDQKWVRIDTQGNIVGECGSSENKKTQTDACLKLKLVACPNQRGLRLLERKNERGQKAKQS